MKGKQLIWSAFFLTVLLQWSIPVQMIWSAVKISNDGILYKFKTVPVDPGDPFRGKYITLNFGETHLKIPTDRKLSSGQNVYVSFSTDQFGFAKIEMIGEAKPQRLDYLATTINFITEHNDSATVHINYPFSRFYLDEYDAPAAENIYLESAADPRQTTYALVRILNGSAVIKDVFVNDSSIKEMIRTRDGFR